jgi:hypothetical protein
MNDLTRKFITEVAFPEVKTNPKNTNKGLIPRFHQDIGDKYYGATRVSLAKACQVLAEEGFLTKAFIKFNPSKNDKLSEADDMGIQTVESGPHINMKVGRDGKLSTPIYWITGDADIPRWAADQGSRKENFRKGQEWANNGAAPAEENVPL